MNSEQVIQCVKALESETNEILTRFVRTENGLYLEPTLSARVKEIVLEISNMLHDNAPGTQNSINDLRAAFQCGLGPSRKITYRGVQDIGTCIRSILTRIERNPELISTVESTLDYEETLSERLGRVNHIIDRFHAVAIQIRNRHNSRQTLDVEDEYDVQDLMHALLTVDFKDIRSEEWTPSYAGSCSRVDFLLPEIETVIEIKKIRHGLNAKKLSEELIIDIARYKVHPQCKRLFCFVYDPEGKIANPAGVELDIMKGVEKIEVIVKILPPR